MEQIYLNAKEKFKEASQEAREIRFQSEESIKQQEKQYQTQITTDLERLKITNVSTIYYQRQKIQKQISQRIIASALLKVDFLFQKGLNRKMQKSVNSSSIQSLHQII